MSRPPSSVPLSLICFILLGCGGGDGGSAAKVAALEPASIFNDRDADVVVRGEGLAGTTRVLLWAGTPERLQRQLGVSAIKDPGDAAITVTVPAGSMPGEYMVVLQSEAGTSFSEIKLKISDRPGDGAPEVLRVQGALFSDVPSRMYLVGPGVGKVSGIQVVDRDGVTFSHLRAYSGARLGASLEEGALAPGSYKIRLQTGKHGWTDGPEIKVTRSGHAADSALCFTTYFGVLGAVFLVGMILAFRQGDIGLKTPGQRRNFALLLSGFVFTFALLGSVQLGLSWWR